MKFNLIKESINYIKITYKDNDGFAHCIKAAIKYMNDVEILACAKFEDYLKVETPQEIELGVACDNGLYKSKTMLTIVSREDSYLLFSMRKPEEMEYQQNREYFRVKLQENVNILYETGGKETNLPAITYDISANGVRTELDTVKDFPENVRIVLFLPKKNINVQAKYIRTDEEDNIIKASFQFTNISQADLDYLSQICFQKQLEERRKSLI